jgi:hypothetical protein
MMGLHGFLTAQVDAIADRMEAMARRLIQTITNPDPEQAPSRRLLQVLEKEIRHPTLSVR